MKKLLKKLFIFFLSLIFLVQTVFAATSVVTRFPTKEVSGAGPLPYNYRVIDGHIHVGGHPLNPATNFKNSDEQATAILAYLRAQGVSVVVNLENTWSIYWRYKRLLRESGLECLPIPLNEQKTPTKAEWEEIKDAMNQPVYIHCKWGADRTGAIIARYLVEERGYTPEEAYKAVITGGTHAGPLGGLKQGKAYDNLVRFFWPHK
jgi:hypothetical protein